jgi:hypothetical protein
MGSRRRTADLKRDYVHLDVFADRAFAGDQLAVFTDAAGLDGPTMQHVANEMAFAETTVVFPSDSRVQSHVRPAVRDSRGSGDGWGYRPLGAYLFAMAS